MLYPSYLFRPNWVPIQINPLLSCKMYVIVSLERPCSREIYSNLISWDCGKIIEGKNRITKSNLRVPAIGYSSIAAFSKIS
jgi:hypothetical protein